MSDEKRRKSPTEPDRPDPDRLEKLADDIRQQTDGFENIAKRLENAAERVREVHPGASPADSERVRQSRRG